MKIGVFGTGVDGQTIAGKLAKLGHEVMIGKHDVQVTRETKGWYKLFVLSGLVGDTSYGEIGHSRADSRPR